MSRTSFPARPSQGSAVRLVWPLATLLAAIATAVLGTICATGDEGVPAHVAPFIVCAALSIVLLLVLLPPALRPAGRDEGRPRSWRRPAAQEARRMPTL